MKTEIDNPTLERDFFIAFNANNRKSIDVAVARVAHYRELTTEEVESRLKHIIENIKHGNNLL